MHKRITFSAFFVIVFLSAMGMKAHAQDAAADTVAFVVNCKGHVAIRRADSNGNFQETCTNGSGLRPGDLIYVAGTNRVTLVLADGRQETVSDERYWEAPPRTNFTDAPFWQRIVRCFHARTGIVDDSAGAKASPAPFPDLNLISVEIDRQGTNAGSIVICSTNSHVLWAGPAATTNRELNLVFWREQDKVSYSMPLLGEELAGSPAFSGLRFFKAALCTTNFEIPSGITAVDLEDTNKRNPYCSSRTLSWTNVSLVMRPLRPFKPAANKDVAGELVAQGIVFESIGASTAAMEAYLKAFAETNNLMTRTALASYLADQGLSNLAGRVSAEAW